MKFFSSLFIILLSYFSVCYSKFTLAQSLEEVALATFDLETSELCFPVELADSNKTYEVCMELINTKPEISFKLKNAVAKDINNSDMPIYSQQNGLQLPLVRLGDDTYYGNVTLIASLDTSSGEVNFTVKTAKHIEFNPAHSTARLWNEALLESIRKDFARPTVHARNLFHSAIAMYDAWAVYDDTASTYLLNKTLNGFNCEFSDLPVSQNKQEDQKTALSYAAYRILSHRFKDSPGHLESQQKFDDLMRILGLDAKFTSLDYSEGNSAAIGNYIADCIISYGLQDGSNEENEYSNQDYQPVNDPLFPEQRGNNGIKNPNNWQPLSFELFRDQSGNIFAGETPEFVSPEWGKVYPFALQEKDLNIYQRNGADWWIYHDPGSPPFFDDFILGKPVGDDYKWGFQLVAVWSSHLDPNDNVLWDISPGNIGNIQSYPTTISNYDDFYKLFAGGDPSPGHEINPYTGKPYAPQLVPRADYARVLAEFWADGPDSETPPGHWFTILNYVSDHPELEKRFSGDGSILSDLEWDIKSYMVLGGAMHDAAVTSWGIKGWYDYIRPISAIRYLSELGQSSDSGDLNYDPQGIQLIPGYIELVKNGDDLSGDDGENIGKIKLKAWRGPDFIEDVETDFAGVDWILAENWWPYQRPTFVTPPFAGYISGHSTFSRAAAEVMKLITGDEYFPGGIGEFHAKQNEFLVFEEGPSVDVILQWATYKDASDQTSLSRIWGGIHPPADDIPGRIIGEIIGVDAFQKADRLFKGLIE